MTQYCWWKLMIGGRGSNFLWLSFWLLLLQVNIANISTVSYGIGCIFGNSFNLGFHFYFSWHNAIWQLTWCTLKLYIAKVCSLGTYLVYEAKFSIICKKNIITCNCKLCDGIVVTLASIMPICATVWAKVSILNS